jgi:hypothetical protein
MGGMILLIVPQNLSHVHKIETAFTVNSLNKEHKNFKTKELDIYDRQKHGKLSQFVLEI